MLIEHPLRGSRDSAEFTVLGDAVLLDCFIDIDSLDVLQVFYDYVYLCANLVGEYCELWYYEYGDYSWLVVICDILMYVIKCVELVRDVVMLRQRRRTP